MEIKSTAHQTVARIDRTIAGLADPRHKAMLGAFRTHWWGEAIGDLDLAMSVFTSKETEFWMMGRLPYGEPFYIDNVTQQRATYQAVLDAGLNIAGALFDERFTFADWGFGMETMWASVMPGAAMPNWGAAEPDALYYVEYPMGLFFPYRSDGLLAGEHGWFSSPRFMEKTDRSTIEKLFGQP